MFVAYAVKGEVDAEELQRLCVDAIETTDALPSYSVTCYMGDLGEVPDFLPIHEQDQLHAALRDGAERIILIAVEEQEDEEMADEEEE